MDDRRRGRSRLLLVFVGLVMLLLAGGVALAILAVSPSGLGAALTEFALDQVDTPPSSDSKPVAFIVQRGENTAQVAERLQREGLIENAFFFRQMARAKGLDQSLAAGEYTLRRDMRMSEIMDELQTGQMGQRMLTLLEGWRVEQIIDEMEFRELGSRLELQQLVRAATWQHRFLSALPAGATVEGYLFPDTYATTAETTGAELVKRMLDTFERRVLPEWESVAPAVDISLHEAITIASIVEREARIPAERPIIAAVFLNRLELGMPLQADPTVQYAIVQDDQPMADGYWKKDLTLADLAFDSPYNTYRVAGIPPGPICNPGLSAIQAVLNPADVDYLYFVAKGEDGSHAFARTLDEHNENVSRYQ